MIYLLKADSYQMAIHSFKKYFCAGTALGTRNTEMKK